MQNRIGIHTRERKKHALVRCEAVGEILGKRKCLTWLEIQGYDASAILQLLFAPQPVGRIPRLQIFCVVTCRCSSVMKASIKGTQVHHLYSSRKRLQKFFQQP